MPATVEEIRAAAMRLTEEERGELAEMLWESLDGDGPGGPHLSLDGVTGEELHRELERRAEEARKDPTASLPWEQVRDMR